MARWSTAAIAVVVLAAACGNDDSASNAAASAGDLGVEIVQGDIGEGQVTVGGTAVDYVTVVPDGFGLGDVAPVLVAFPPGGQDIDLTRRIVDGTYRAEAVERGWVVVSPAAPGGQLFFQGAEAVVPDLLDWIETWVTPESGRFHVAGVSNGGLSAFRVAGQQPERVASLLVFPGYPRSDDDRAALDELASVPVRMFVGETDTGWREPMEATEVSILDLGGDVTLEIVAGEGHIIGALSDGVRIFAELDAAR
jgi:poly(3-hydroxybutyrate) depolymerase